MGRTHMKKFKHTKTRRFIVKHFCSLGKLYSLLGSLRDEFVRTFFECMNSQVPLENLEFTGVEILNFWKEWSVVESSWDIPRNKFSWYLSSTNPGKGYSKPSPVVNRESIVFSEVHANSAIEEFHNLFSEVVWRCFAGLQRIFLMYRSCQEKSLRYGKCP